MTMNEKFNVIGLINIQLYRLKFFPYEDFCSIKEIV